MNTQCLCSMDAYHEVVKFCGFNTGQDRSSEKNATLSNIEIKIDKEVNISFVLEIKLLPPMNLLFIRMLNNVKITAKEISSSLNLVNEKGEVFISRSFTFLNQTTKRL